MDVRLGPRMGVAAAFAAFLCFLALPSPAGAASPIGADGTVHGCYVAKGKHKGSLRLLSAGKKCKKRKHEKPIVWSVQGPAGAAGAQGAPGAQGAQGPAGESGISSAQFSALQDRINQQDATIAALNSTIAGLTTTVGGLLTQVGTLTGVLNGISNSDLTGMKATLSGLSNSDLTGAVAALSGISNSDLTGMKAKLSGISHADLVSTVAALQALTNTCAQVSTLTTRANDLGALFPGIALTGTIPALLGLNVPTPPTALTAFSCPPF